MIIATQSGVAGWRYSTVDPQVVSAARHHALAWYEKQCAGWQVEVGDDLELVVSELATNSVRAGATAIDVRMRLIDNLIEVSVIDNGVGWPTLLDPTVTDTHGRGLHIVSALAHRWGVTADADGRTVVWAHLASR